MTKYDLGIAGQFAEVVEQIRKGNVNPLWVRAVFQRIIENDHAGDHALLCRTFLKLRRPYYTQMAELLNVEARSSDRPFGSGIREQLQRLPVNDGPDEVEVVKVTASILFEPTLANWTERTVRKRAFDLFGLVPCPLWVVPAIAIAARQNTDDWLGRTEQMMVCTVDEEKHGAFNVIYGSDWWVHSRSSDLNAPWDPVTWLMAKP